MTAEQIFDEQRPLLFSIAYRMLGSAMDAEDIVQETFLRWYKATGDSSDQIQSPRAYLSTVVTRLSIDQLRSAQARREVYVGPWLPEPISTEFNSDMTDKAELADSLSIAFMVVLESLSPVERAVFLLREVFDYEYDEIAAIVEKSEENCRQMVRRAKQHLAQRRPRFKVSPEQGQQVMKQFLEVCMGGELQALLNLLTEDVMTRSDGGGKVRAALNPIYGRDKVARFLLGLVSKGEGHFTYKLAEVNGQPSLLIRGEQTKLYGVLQIDVAEEKVRAINLVVNPEKLEFLEKSLSEK